jgi:PAS domain S-box-containing protein
MLYLRRLWLTLPFFIAILTFLFLLWGGSVALFYPYDGIADLSATGVIREIEKVEPLNDQLREGDVIIAINGVKLNEAWPFYPNQRAGDQVVLTIQRGESEFSVPITLRTPTPRVYLNRLMPLVVALIFWVVGVGVRAFMARQEGTQVFFLFFQTAALVLIAGASSAFGPQWTAVLFVLISWLIGPLLVHFHLYFPQKAQIKGQSAIMKGLYAVGGIGAALYLYLVLRDLLESEVYTNLLVLNRIFLALNFLLTAALLYYAYRTTTSAGVRSQIRLVLLGGALSLLPPVALILLPEALLGRSLLPIAMFTLFLGILPLTYGYAILRYRLIEIERHVNRGATFILVYSILGMVYLLLSYAVSHVFPGMPINEPLINTALVLILATLYVPLQQFVQRVVDTAFYGGWYDYRSAISVITQGLEQITDLQALADTVTERLVRVIRLEEVCLFMADVNGDYSVISVAPRPPTREARRTYSPLPRSSLSYLLHVGGSIEREVLRQALGQAALSPAEVELLNTEQTYLWVPIIGHGNVLGLLALGPKFGGDIFSGEDTDILRVTARHLAPLIENVHLVMRLRQHNALLEQRVIERTEELNAAKKRVEAILASVGEGVVVTDLEGHITLVNTAFEDQTGYELNALIGMELWSLYEVEDVRTLRQQISDATAGGAVWSGELVGLRKDGGRYDVLMTIAPLRDESGGIMGYVGSQRDVTQQKELDRLKDLFVSDVSHELRTPTTNIGLYLELLESAPPEKRAHYLQVLKDQSNLLIKLVEDILDLSRLTRGKSRRVDFGAVDLNEVLDRVVTAHRPLAEAAGLDLVFEPMPNLPPLLGEPNQLARLATNLVANAIHYTPKGTVYVRTFERNNCVCLEVEDTGIGIDPEDQPHIFDRFYRGRMVRQSKIHGTGLGLAIVKEIAEMHESHIEVQSEIGKGSTFCVYFPVLRGEEWLVKPSLS